MQIYKLCSVRAVAAAAAVLILLNVYPSNYVDLIMKQSSDGIFAARNQLSLTWKLHVWKQELTIDDQSAKSNKDIQVCSVNLKKKKKEKSSQPLTRADNYYC